jgi:hypothetical protein
MTAVLPVPVKIFEYISKDERASLFVVSSFFVGAPITCTLQQRLMRMTLRANAERQRNAALLMHMTLRANAERQRNAALQDQYAEDLQSFRTMHTEYGRMLRMLEMQDRQLAALAPAAPTGEDRIAIDAEDIDEGGDIYSEGDTDAEDTSVGGDTEDTHEGDETDAEDTDEGDNTCTELNTLF